MIGVGSRMTAQQAQSSVDIQGDANTGANTGANISSESLAIASGSARTAPGGCLYARLWLHITLACYPCLRSSAHHALSIYYVWCRSSLI